MRSFVFLLSLLFFAPTFAAGIPVFYDPGIGTPSQQSLDDVPIKITGQQRCVGARSIKKVTIYGALDFAPVGVRGLIKPAVKKQSGTQVAPWQTLTAGHYTMIFDVQSTAQKTNKNTTITKFVGADQAGQTIKGTLRYNYKTSAQYSSKPAKNAPKYAIAGPIYITYRQADTFTELIGTIKLINGGCSFTGKFSDSPLPDEA